MSFDKRLLERFEHVIRPAIEDEVLGPYRLKAYRVDNSKTGDSILTDIANGVAHSRLILADVSVIDEGRYSGYAVRNGNVMYEVGLALAARQPSEVLLVRDDDKPFLFDVSSIPHMAVDFSDRSAAIARIRAGLVDRINETDALRDARIAMATRTLNEDELRVLRVLSKLAPNEARDLALAELQTLSIPDERGVSGLLEKGAIKSVGVNPKNDCIFYCVTPFGYALAEAAERDLKPLTPKEPSGPPPPAA